MEFHQKHTSIALNKSLLNCIDLHRFGFNGQEKPACRNLSAGRDDEWTGSTGATYDYGFRIYDSRIARWMSIDPLFSNYPDVTPYNYSFNSPVKLRDPDGRPVVDAEGNLIVTYHYTTGYRGTQTINENNEYGGVTKVIYDVTQIQGTAYTNDYTPFSVNVTVNVTAKKYTYDKEGHLVGEPSAYEVNEKVFDANSNCHGLAYLEGKGWITDDKSLKAILRDEYSESTSSNADRITLTREGIYSHSIIVNKNGTYTAKDTDSPIFLNTNKQTAMGSKFMNDKENYFEKNSNSNITIEIPNEKRESPSGYSKSGVTFINQETTDEYIKK